MKQPFLTMYCKSLKKYTAIVTLFLFCLPFAVFSQEQEQEQEQQIDVPAVETNTGTLNTSPWPSNNGAATQDNQQGSNATSSSTTSARPGSNPALRPVGGGTPTAGGPGGGGGIGGNPDVPFDDNMNLAFLAVGFVFVVVVFKKRYALVDKIPVSTEKK